MFTQAEENYIKAIFHLSGTGDQPVSTGTLAEKMKTKSSSVTDMIKRLSDKRLVKYAPYYGAHLTQKGKTVAIEIIRKHRLWETFLVEKLRFSWDKVHDIAEQLEHVRAPELIERLDAFLNHPATDPHGDPIPDKEGRFRQPEGRPLCEFKKGDKLIFTGLNDTSSKFLNYLSKHGLSLGDPVTILDVEEFDNTISIRKKGGKVITISNFSACKILVKTQREG